MNFFIRAGKFVYYKQRPPLYKYAAGINGNITVIWLGGEVEGSKQAFDRFFMRMKMKVFTHQQLAVEAHREWVSSWIIESPDMERIYTFKNAPDKSLCHITYNDGSVLYAAMLGNSWYSITQETFREITDRRVDMLNPSIDSYTDTEVKFLLNKNLRKK